jgi:pilus assembly protein CpaE
MLSVALYTPNLIAADGIEQLTQESNVFNLVVKASPIPPIPSVLRELQVRDPDVILLDLGDWDAVSQTATAIERSSFKGVTIGFRPVWTKTEELTFEEMGIRDVLHEPFSHSELERAADQAIHRDHAITKQNILAFIPAKAGGGCSTVALNTGTALANSFSKSVLLVESDARSGTFSILLNLQNRLGLSDALKHAGEMTPSEWRDHYVEALGMHVLLADAKGRGARYSWIDYYNLLRFVHKKYDFVLVDMPEAVNDATAEVVKSAHWVFIVCTPEILSLKLAKQRCAELEAFEVPRNKVQIVLNRWVGKGLSIQDVEGILERQIFATLPNDYAHIQDAILESRLVTSETPFGEGCRTLARKAGGLPDPPPERSKFALLRKLAR